MNRLLRAAIGATAVALAGHAAAEATLYEHHDYLGKALMTPDAIPDLGRWGFGGNASSMVVAGAPWQVCEGPGFSGRCTVLPPGNYRNVREMGLSQKPWSARPAPPPPPPPPPAPVAYDEQGITFYEHDGFAGRRFTTRADVPDFRSYGFNDRASSVSVSGPRWDRWEVCEDAGYAGHCVILRPGVYPSLGALGLNDRISSAREVQRDADRDDDASMPPPTPLRDWHARPDEQLFDVPVSDVRAVYGTPTQRCWVERRQVVQQGDPGAGAVIGGLIGGILGHELAGRGSKDVGTVGGAIAGAAIGATASQGYVAGTQDVQRCATVPTSGAPAYWDVTYVFDGMVHHVQMTNPPAGNTLRVNERGEPRD